MNLQRYGLHERLFDRFGVAGDAIYLLREPLLFPSLGPTVFLFFEKPLEKTSSPRSALLGHFVALAVGYVSLSLDAPSTLETGVTGARVGTAAYQSV